MSTSRAELEQWFLEGLRQQATHMIVVCDTFDWEDYPVYVSKQEDVRKKVSEYDAENMQRVMEVYNLSKSMEDQLRPGTRVFNY